MSKPIRIHQHRVVLNGLKRTTVKSRLERGWPLEKALNTPVIPKAESNRERAERNRQLKAAASTDIFSIAWGRAAG